MKIKRYFAKDMRQAIRMVREEQGPDAVILSNRRVDGGVEIVAAVDYDESLVSRMAAEQAPRQAPQQTPGPESVAATPMPVPPVPTVSFVSEQRTTPALPPSPAGDEPLGTALSRSEIVWSQEPSLVAMREELQGLRGMLESQLNGLAWGEMRRSQPQRVKLLERLTQLGLSATLSKQLAARIDYKGDSVGIWRQALALLAAQVRVTDDDIIQRGGIVALIGPTGVGKTTTVAKLAARYTLRHGAGRVALVTTDSYRIGAQQQLNTFGKILGAPVHVARNGEELRKILLALRDKSLVLIDTAGMSQRDVRLSEQLSMLYQTGLPVRSYAVLSASAQRRGLEEVINTFNKVELDGAILTKLDETTGLGEALSVVVQNRLPVAYISDGQRVPEDLHPARSNNLVNRSLSLMQNFAEHPTQEHLARAFGAMVG
ncbi:MAG: flagellar biosynthesis protein FlhF [Gammaproteobacteria bacterium]|nr:flagellar biosynthesis protein FlhF [Gammaproteobacteria bacterium]